VPRLVEQAVGRALPGSSDWRLESALGESAHEAEDPARQRPNTQALRRQPSAGDSPTDRALVCIGEAVRHHVFAQVGNHVIVEAIAKRFWWWRR
jgi:hypothetical protein